MQNGAKHWPLGLGLIDANSFKVDANTTAGPAQHDRPSKKEVTVAAIASPLPTMIALRGIVRQNEEKKWTWKGIWTFGSLPKDEEAALQAKNPSVRPFVYSWEEARNASDVLVPSANVKKEPQEKEVEESSNVAADSSSVISVRRIPKRRNKPLSRIKSRRRMWK